MFSVDLYEIYISQNVYKILYFHGLGICLGPSIVNPTSFCYWLNNDVRPCFSDFIYLFIYLVFGATLLFPL